MLERCRGKDCWGNEGISAGQDVPHVHLHMVPRKKGDAGIYEYEPRKFLYRPGSREKTPEDELKKIVEQIQKSLKVDSTHYFENL